MSDEDPPSDEDLLTIVACGDPVLRRPADPMDPADLASSEIRRLVSKMQATMAAAPGVGLAAPQIGEAIQLAVLEDGPERWGALTEQERAFREREALPFTVLVNPRYESLDDRDQVSFFEGCLSVPGLTGVVARHRRVRVTGFDERGEPVDRYFAGWQARIVQHEVDHLHGVLYLDRVETRSLSTVDNYARRWAGRSLREAAEGLGFVLATQITQAGASAIASD